MGESYISNISGVDVQGIVNGEDVRKDHIRQLRSMSLHLNLRARNTLLFEENQAILEDPELVKLESQAEALYTKTLTDTGPELAQEYQRVVCKRKRCYNRLHSQLRQRCRELFFRSANTQEIQRQIEEGEQGISNCEDEELPALEFVSFSHFPDRYAIATAFWTSSSTNDALPDPVLAHIRKLCEPELFVLYYPGESPLEGRCPLCGLSIEQVIPRDRPKHIHECFATKNQEEARVEFEQKCPVQCKWGRCTNKFAAQTAYLSEDFGRDISDPEERRLYREKESKRLYDKRRRLKHAPLTAKAGTQSRKSISNHLTAHIKKQTQCLWEDCQTQCLSERDLKRHLSNDHGVSVRQAPFQPKFCLKHPQDGWYTCEFEWDDHCQLHVEDYLPNLDLQRTYHAFTAGLQCPYCLGNENIIASERFTQYTKRETFHRHMESHLKGRSLNCPIAACRETVISNDQELQSHFFDIHGLSPKGYSLSRGFRTQDAYQQRRKDLYQDDHNIADDTDSDNKTSYEEGSDEWDNETLYDDVNEDAWEDVSDDDPEEDRVSSLDAAAKPVMSVGNTAIRPLKRKSQPPSVFSKRPRLDTIQEVPDIG
jgi:hypothetical protein